MIISTIFGLIALILLFFKLPGVSACFEPFVCNRCMLTPPYIAVIGAGYFAALTAAIISFPTLPSGSLRLGGLVWAVGLSITLTWIAPTWCLFCLLAHGCHILMWLFWKTRKEKPEKNVGKKITLICLIALAAMGLYYGLNHVFILYAQHRL